MAGVKVIHPYITQKKEVQGGRPIIKGTRIPVSTIIIRYKQGEGVDEILELYPELTPAKIHDTLSYYYDHQEEVEKELALLLDEERWQRQYPPTKGNPAKADETHPD